MPKTTTPEQTFEFLAWMDDLLHRFYADRKGRLALDLGYADPSPLRHISAGRCRPSPEKYEAMKALWEEKTKAGGTTPTAVAAPSPAPSPTNVLGELERLYADVGRLAERARALSEVCVPLLRPGIIQYAQTLEAGRKILKIA